MALNSSIIAQTLQQKDINTAQIKEVADNLSQREYQIFAN